MSFMWHSKAAKAAAEEDDEGEEILSSCNSSSNNQNEHGGGGGDCGGEEEEAATVSKSNDYISRVTSETLFPPPPPPPILDPVGSWMHASFSPSSGEDAPQQSPPSPMSVASSDVDQVVSASLFGEMLEKDEEAPFWPSPSPSISSNLSMKPEGLSDSLLDEVAPRLSVSPPFSEPQRPLVETVGPNTDKDEDDDDDECYDEAIEVTKKREAERPSEGYFMEPRDGSVAVTQQVDYESVGKANSEQLQPPPLTSPPTDVKTLARPQDEATHEVVSASIRNAQQQPPPPPALTETATSPKEDEAATNGQQHMLPWLAGKLNLPKLDFSAFRFPTSLAGGHLNLCTTVVAALACMVAVATILGLLLSVNSFFHYPKMHLTVPPPPPAAVAIVKGVSPMPMDACPIAQKKPIVMPKEVMKEPIFKQPNTTLVQVAQDTTTPSMVPPETASSQAVIDDPETSTAAPLSSKKALGSTTTTTAALNMVEVQVSEESHEVIDLDDDDDDDQQEKYQSATSGPKQKQRQQKEQQRATKVLPSIRKWSHISFMSATVYLSIVAFSAFILWLVLGGNAKQAPRSKTFPPVATTGWNFETIRTALEEPLSGKGRHTKAMMTPKDLGWDPTNYKSLKMDEIHRLLHLLHAPSYNRNMNKSLLLCFLYEHYGTLLHKCNTQQLKAILQYKGVRYSFGTKRMQLVQLALYAGFTAKQY